MTIAYAVVAFLALLVGYWCGWWDRGHAQRRICDDCERIAKWQATEHIKQRRGKS